MSFGTIKLEKTKLDHVVVSHIRDTDSRPIFILLIVFIIQTIRSFAF